MRLKLDGAVDFALPSEGLDLGRILKALPGVRDIQVNILARSCVVEYDPATIPDTAWPDLLAGRSTHAAQTLHVLFAHALSHASSDAAGSARHPRRGGIHHLSD